MARVLADKVCAQLSTVPAALPLAKQNPYWAGEAFWNRRHEAKLAEIAAGPKEYDFVFIGDSITHNWEGWSDPIDIKKVTAAYESGLLKFPNGPGRRVYEEMKSEFRLLNLGMGGDCTQQVLWRLENGELDGYRTRGVMLMIGTNNGGRPEEVAAGVKAILDKIAEKQPAARTILLPIFPHMKDPGHERRRRNDAVNGIIRGYADGKKVVWCDFNDRFLSSDGTLSEDMMPDLLHPLESGYRIWRAAVEPKMREIAFGDGRPNVMEFSGDWDFNSSVSGHVTEIITQTKVRHLPVIFAGDRDEAAARVRAKPFMEVGHPVYIMDSCREEDILALARKLKGRYDLKPKLEVTGPACVPAAAVYRKYRDEQLFTWVHAVDAPDGFTSEDLTYEPTPVRASKAFARRFVRPVSIARNAAGNWLVDFGRAAFGWVEARTPSAVRAVAGEKLTDAKSVDVIPFSAIRSAEACAAAPDGAEFKRLVFKTEIYSRGRCLSIPRELGEVMPMRYLEVPADSFEPTAENVRMVALEYPFDEGESGFVSDNRLLDDVYGLCKYTLRACTFGGLYIDGDRERLPYEADAWVTQLSNHAMSSDYEVSRVTCDYLMPYPTWPTEYRQISVLLNWTYWMWSGRDDLLRKHYAQLKDEKLMERFRRESDGLLETGGEMSYGAYEGAADIADWPPSERFGFEFRKVNAVVNAYYYIGLNEMAEIATQIGKADDADAFRARARRVYDSFQKAFFDARRGIYVDGEGATHASIHANAIAVVAGLVPENSLKGVGDWLAGREMECSVYFAQHFLEALFRTGHGARAVALMTADNDRSWVGMLKAGATLTKESWNEGVRANIDWNHTWGAAAINIIDSSGMSVGGISPLRAV